MNRVLDILAPFALITLLLAGWEIACRVTGVPAKKKARVNPTSSSPADSSPTLVWQALSTTNSLPFRSRP